MNCVCSQFHDLNLRDVVMWQRPIASGIVLLVSLGLWSLFAIFDYTIVTFLAHAFLLVFMIGAGITLVKGTVISSNEIPGKVDAIYETVRPYFLRITEIALEYLTWKDFKASAKLFAATFIIGFIGKYLSDKAIIFMAIISAFSLPIVEDKYGDEIEQLLAYSRQMLAHLPKYAEKASTHLPPGVKDAYGKARNYVKTHVGKYIHKNNVPNGVNYTSSYSTSNDASSYAEEQLNAMEQKMQEAQNL